MAASHLIPPREKATEALRTQRPEERNLLSLRTLCLCGFLALSSRATPLV